MDRHAIRKHVGSVGVAEGVQSRTLGEAIRNSLPAHRVQEVLPHLVAGQAVSAPT